MKKVIMKNNTFLQKKIKVLGVMNKPLEISLFIWQEVFQISLDTIIFC